MASDDLDHYATLGVARDSTERDIRRAYRAAVLREHPDRNPGDESAAGRFRRIAAAYEVLGSADRRARYDADFSNAAEVLAESVAALRKEAPTKKDAKRVPRAASVLGADAIENADFGLDFSPRKYAPELLLGAGLGLAVEAATWLRYTGSSSFEQDPAFLEAFGAGIAILAGGFGSAVGTGVGRAFFSEASTFVGKGFALFVAMTAAAVGALTVAAPALGFLGFVALFRGTFDWMFYATAAGVAGAATVSLFRTPKNLA